MGAQTEAGPGTNEVAVMGLGRWTFRESAPGGHPPTGEARVSEGGVPARQERATRTEMEQERVLSGEWASSGMLPA